MIKLALLPAPPDICMLADCALLCILIYLQKNKGKFLLRIEDTDRERYVADGVANILKSLYWAGIVPDEGVILGEDGKICEDGKNGPYTQSERLPIYKEHVETLFRGRGMLIIAFAQRKD